MLSMNYKTRSLANCDKNLQNTWNGFAKMKNDTFEIKNFCINCDEFLKNYLKPNAPQTF